jgi:hypothetical protein
MIKLRVSSRFTGLEQETAKWPCWCMAVPKSFVVSLVFKSLCGVANADDVYAHTTAAPERTHVSVGEWPLHATVINL